MQVTQSDIKNLADLARIEMTESEMGGLAHDFDSILAYVDQINQVDLPEISAKPELSNVARIDGNSTESGTYSDKMIVDAPDSQDGFYKVPKIL